MKKIIYLFALSLIFMFSCNDELSNSVDVSPEALKVETNNPSIFISKIDSKSISKNLSNVNLEALREQYSSKLYSKSGDKSNKSEFSGSHTNGHFTIQEGNTFTFSSGDDGYNGKWASKGVANYKGDVVCTNIVDNQVVIQVVITEVGEIPAEAFELVVGNSLFFLLQDNGEGHNALSDQYFPWILVLPSLDFSVCNEDFGAGQEEGLSPGFYLFIMDVVFGHPSTEWKDTFKKSDQIQIK